MIPSVSSLFQQISNVTIVLGLDCVTYLNNMAILLYFKQSIMKFSPLRSTSGAIIFYRNSALQAINDQNSLKFT